MMYLGHRGPVRELAHHTIYWPRTTRGTSPRSRRGTSCRTTLPLRAERLRHRPVAGAAAAMQHALRAGAGDAPSTRERGLAGGGAALPRGWCSSGWRKIGLDDVESRIRFETHGDAAPTGETSYAIHPGATFNLAHNLRPDAPPPAAQPLRGPGRRLSGRRRHASRQRPAGDLRVGAGSPRGCWPRTSACDVAVPRRAAASTRSTWRRRCAGGIAGSEPDDEHVITSVRDAQVGVIGGGLGGLAAAARWRRRAATRSRCSRRTPGSAARRRCWTSDGFRFDMGPTILTVPRCCAASSPRPGATGATTST